MAAQEPEPLSDPPTTLRERRRVITRRDISEAALELFERQGYENTTVEQIADAAGVSMRTFYRYCSGKDETLTFDLATGPTQLTARIRSYPTLALREALVAGFLDAVDSDERRVLRAIRHTPALSAAWLAAGRAAQEDLVDVLASRQPGASRLRIQAQAAAIIGALTAVIEAWAEESGVDLEQLTREALDVLTL